MAKYTITLNDILRSELQKAGHNEFVNNGRLTFNNEEFAFIQKILRFDEDVKNIVDDKIFKGFKFNDERIDRYFKEAFITRFLDRQINRQTIEAFASQVLYVSITHEDYIYTVFGNDMQRYLENHTTTDTEDKGNQLSQDLSNTNATENARSHSTDDFTGNVTADATSKESNESGDVSESRSAEATLPQSEINLDVNNDVLTYADSNTISKDKATHDSLTQGENHSDTDTKNDTISDSEDLRNSRTDTTANHNSDTWGTHSGLNKNFSVQNLQQIYDMRDMIFDTYDKKCFLQIW